MARSTLAIGIAFVAVLVVGCDSLPPEGRAGEALLNEVEPPSGFQVTFRGHDGNGRGTAVWDYVGPASAVNPGDWQVPEGYTLISEPPVRDWAWEMSLVAKWMGPSPTEPGECELLLEIPEDDWDDRVTTRYSMAALCYLDRYTSSST